MTKTTTMHLLAVTLCVSALTPTAYAWDFSYGYTTVYDSNAATYIVGQQNVRQYTEWQNPAITYWGPSANDVQGTLTSQFTFSAPSSEIFLHFRLDSASCGDRGDYGASSLWASTDGNSWQLLADCPTPTGDGGLVGQEATYNQDVPSSLLGATQLWLQVRMQEHNALTTTYDPRATWADAQFSRWDFGGPGGFQLNAAVVPEPATGSVLMAGGLAVLGALSRKRRA